MLQEALNCTTKSLHESETSNTIKVEVVQESAWASKTTKEEVVQESVWTQFEWEDFAVNIAPPHPPP